MHTQKRLILELESLGRFEGFGVGGGGVRGGIGRKGAQHTTEAKTPNKYLCGPPHHSLSRRVSMCGITDAPVLTLFTFIDHNYPYEGPDNRLTAFLPHGGLEM